MGGIVSAGEDNDELVDNLVDAGAVRSAPIEKALRLIDRGNYYLQNDRSAAYKDIAWRSNSGAGLLHLSAPCIYANVLEALQLSSGHSFLNIGSGTGYLSTVAGVLIGSGGVNHGIEVHEDVVDYAEKHLAEMLSSPGAIDLCDFAIPQFVVGNGLLLDPSLMGSYDRVYCGAGVSPRYHRFVCSFVRIGGICVLPFGDQLQKVTRTAMDSFDIEDVQSVTFASMLEPSAETISSGVTVCLPDRGPRRLLSSCRSSVRAAVRAHLLSELNIKIRCRTGDFPATKCDDGGRATSRCPRRRPLIMLAPELSDDDADEVVNQRRRILRQRFFAAIAERGRVAPPSEAAVVDDAEHTDDNETIEIPVSFSESEEHLEMDSDNSSADESVDDLESIQTIINISALLDDAAESSNHSAMSETATDAVDSLPRTSSKRTLSESSTLSNNSAAPRASKRRMHCGHDKASNDQRETEAKKQQERREEKLLQDKQVNNFSVRMVAALRELPVTDQLREYLTFGRGCQSDEIADD